MMRELGGVPLPDGAGQYPPLGPPGRYLVDVGARGRAATRWRSIYPLRSARLGATTLPDSSDVVLEAVARPVRESRRVLGQTREGLEKGGEKEAIVVGEKEKEWTRMSSFSRENMVE